MRSWYRDVAQRRRASPGTGIHGAGSLDWGNPDTLALDRLRFQEADSADEPGSNGSVLIYNMLGPLDADVRAADRIYWAAAPGGPILFEVDGEPVRHRGITGATAHSLTKLRGNRVR